MAVEFSTREIGYPDHALLCRDAASLAVILMPEMNLAIWGCEDSPVVPVSSALERIGDIGLTIEADKAGVALSDALAAASYPPKLIEPLASDIASHVRRLADLLDQDCVAIRLEVVETDACRRFHADHVSIRLILTYSGLGTQWLDNADAERLRDGAAIESLEIRRIATGHVALFKGREWAPDRPIVHRSPPIAGSGERRLVLVIDPVSVRPVPHK